MREPSVNSVKQYCHHCSIYPVLIRFCVQDESILKLKISLGIGPFMLRCLSTNGLAAPS